MILTLKILQVSLFAVPVVALIVLGLVILLRPVAVINRRWLLLTFLPLLVANLLAAVVGDTQNGIALLPDWRFWAMVVVDVALAVGISIWLRGVALYGLPLATAEALCKEALEAQGYSVTARIDEKRTLLTTVPQATILTVTIEGREEEFWLTLRAGEVVVRTDSQRGMALLRQKVLPALRDHQTPYVFQAHAMGVLYLVLAVVLLTFGWIYFFEPRLVLVE
jgi:hypothetical protein